MTGEDFFLRVASRPPMNKLHPAMGQFFKNYLRGEKAIEFDGKLVLNTQFPPYPSPAFDRLAEQLLPDGEQRPLYSLTWAITNRCDFNCWHCYNAGRSHSDLPLPIIRQVAAELQDLGAAMITLTGGEPLQRDDLDQICRAFDDRSCLIVGTTGWGLTPDRARAMRDAGVFGIGISLDSSVPKDHDRMRGRNGAFRAALDAIAAARNAGLYAYVVSVATREFLQPDRFWPFISFAREIGALEVHLLEPCPVGRLANRSDVVLSAAEREQIIEYQMRAAADETMPLLSTFAYVEDRRAFGCAAGISHLYIDGSGELCPCNLVPMSFGNVARRPLREILADMGRHFVQPHTGCVGRIVSRHIPEGDLPCPREISERICEEHLPQTHAVPQFVQVRISAHSSAGATELAAAYDHVAEDYGEFWLTRAGDAVESLVRKLDLRGDETVFEAGCGTGFGTALLAAQLARGGRLIAVDISDAMLNVARARLNSHQQVNVQFLHDDALAALGRIRNLDVVTTTWVLGYIPLRPFFAAAAAALKPGGRLGLVVHRENSPRREWEAFAEIVARDPSILTKQVAFDFPKGPDHLADELRRAGFTVTQLWEDAAVFRYRSPKEVLDHLLKSGAGTVFHDALAPTRRTEATQQFVELLKLRNQTPATYEVRHDYLACIAHR